LGGISIISDIHVAEAADEHYALLLKFMQHPVVTSSSNVFFLGDIFDLLVGEFQEYQTSFAAFFHELDHLLDKNITIYYLEGNHDFHAENLFLQTLKSKNKKLFHYCRRGVEKYFWDKKYYLSHGDEIDLGDPGYKIYTQVIRSSVVNLLINRVLPYQVVSDIGAWASGQSKARNHDRYTSPDREKGTKALFRQAVSKEVAVIGCDFFICGHSHVKDRWDLTNGLYLNNGYVPLEKSFLYIDNNRAAFVTLNS
jgi:UDP-2,3-diacylglucosamine hydrolase